MDAQVEARAHERDLVLANLVTERSAGRTVVLEGNRQPARQIPETGDDDERRRVLSLAPGQPADFVVRDKGGIGPEAVAIKAAANARAERNEVRVVEEHHALAEDLAMQHDDLI